MHENRNKQLDYGMRLVSGTSEVMPEQADERIRSVYHDIRKTLRVPFVNFIFRVLANYPDFLEQSWAHLSPVLRTLAFEGAADNLRSRALLEPIPGTSDVDFAALGDLEKIRSFTDSIHYVLPKLLLIATAWDEPLPEGILKSNVGDVNAADLIPAGVAEGTISIQMVNPKEATGKLKSLFQDIQQSHNHPGVASYYRALGHWPEFLDLVWYKIKPLIGTIEYVQRRRDLIKYAQHAVGELPLTEEQVQGIDTEQVEEIRSILAVFRFRLIPDLLIDVTLIKAMLDGPEAALFSRFSVP